MNVGIETKMLQLKSLKETEGNPQYMDDKTFSGIVDSMKRKGWLLDAPVVWEKGENDYQIISGHHRVQAAIQAGIIETQCKVLKGITEENAKLLVLEANQRKGSFDDDILKDFIDDIVDKHDYDIDSIIGEVGFEDDIFNSINVEPDEKDDVVPEVKESFSQSGDLYILGSHRILCGDSSKVEKVEYLMNNKKLDMVFTDPPYGVSIGNKNKLLDSFQKGGRIKENINNDCLSPELLKDLLIEIFKNIKKVSNDVCSYFVTAPQGGDLGMMMMMMKESGLPVRHIIIWVKNRQAFSLGRIDYEYKHEPILYTWNKSHKFYAKGNQRSSVWNIDRENKCDLHPTMKPVELIVNAIMNNSIERNIVGDFFLGSGSTLISCQKTNRICYGIELDPHYIDVIVKRYTDYIGSKDKCFLIRDGNKIPLDDIKEL
jgi:DNA modification methylase